MNSINKLHFLKFFIIGISFLSFSSLFAEGSKDLYPTGAEGGRAFLLSLTEQNVGRPFLTRGDHYVYAEIGEWISMASSAQQYSTIQRIKLYDPNGNEVSLSFASNNVGNIPNRNAELAGSAFPNSTPTGNQYTGVVHQATMSGIYKVEFISTSSYGHTRQDVPANANWTQHPSSGAIAAWDVSVCNENKTNWIPGRAYTYLYAFAMQDPEADPSIFYGGFHGIFKVLTHEGYLYNVDSNGMNGAIFTFTVNNRGFHAPNNPEQQIYKSVEAPSIADIDAMYHNPNLPDDDLTATLKIFYTFPDINMPETAIGGQEPGSETWLYPTVKPPLIISDIQAFGWEDNTHGQMTNVKGGTIKFNANQVGNYKIVLTPSVGSTPFTPIEIQGTCNEGANSIYINGEDGDGIPLPDDVIIDFEFIPKVAEVHFPYFDMEENPEGLILELYNPDLTTIASDIVYWNDEDIPDKNEAIYGPNANPKINLNGISSHLNGHKWGILPAAVAINSYGDNHGIDTWTLILEPPIEAPNLIKIATADLEITELTADKEDCTLQEGDHLIYTIKVKNDGPSDAEGATFKFQLPSGFTNVDATFINTNNCGAEVISIAFDVVDNEYIAVLDLPNSCEITYEIETQVTTTSEADATAQASILRPADVADPDATNPELWMEDPDSPGNEIHYFPTDALEECNNNQSPVSPTEQYPYGCNNIMELSISIPPTITLTNESNPTECNTEGDIELTFTHVPDGEYTLTYDGGAFANVVVSNNQATISVTSGQYNNLTIEIDECISQPISLTISETAEAPEPPIVSLYEEEDCINNSSVEITNYNSDYNYTYSPNTANEIAPGIVSGEAGSYTVTVENAEGCTSSSTFTINENLPFPFVEPIDNQEVCSGNPITISFSGTTGATFMWTNNNTTIGLPENGTSNSETFLATNTTSLPISGEISVVPSIEECVGEPEIFTITVNPGPVLSVSDDVSICFGENVTLNADGAENYSWSPDASLNNSSTNTVIASPSVTTTYIVTGSSHNCSATESVTVTVNPIPAVNAGDDQVMCHIGEITLVATGADNYIWSDNVINGVPFTIDTTTTFTVIGSSEFGCTATDQVTVFVNNSNIAFTSENTKGCQPLKVSFSNQTTGIFTSYLWGFGDGNTSTSMNPVHTYTAPGCFDITLTAYNTEIGCTEEITLFDYICVSSSPIADFSASTFEITNLDNEVIFFNQSENAIFYEWSFGDNSGIDNTINPSHSYSTEDFTNYIVTLVALNNEGCSDTAMAIITINKEQILYVPNTFTPNDDNHNNIFLPIIGDGYDLHEYTMYIFNRWGELIFETHNSAFGWDGTYLPSGEVVTDGVYIWTIQLKMESVDKRVVRTGHVTLLR